MAQRRLPTVVDSILNSLEHYPVPTATEQIEYGRAVRAWQDWSGGPDAAPPRVRRFGLKGRERLVTGNLRLVVNVAKKYQSRGIPLEDLIQEGSLGLTTAAEKYDPGRGYMFSTYSYWWVKQRILRYVIDKASLIRVPGSTNDDLFKVRRQLDGCSGQRSDKELLVAAGLKELPDTMVRLRDAMRARACGSTSVLLPSGGGCIEDLQASPTGGKDDQYEALERAERQALVCKLLAELPDNERQVWELRVVEGVPRVEVAQILNISVSAVGELKRRAIAHLQALVAQQDAGLQVGYGAALAPVPAACQQLQLSLLPG
jgi:RNA polymerase sigma factor (sigma-70 family)